ncbi:TPA: translation initiation factor IF-2, partial [Candidatus Micrarchaeota archaeon]|nr:translation initiation factor IF-2 [Candidatus Micrarchaeota archaeon]
VDHGKTTLLDAVRKSSVQSREAGAITQHVGASEVPVSVIRERCEKLLGKTKLSLTLPGLLFIDTPGHEAFANLRKRGGSIADIAILVVDINQGIQNQTKEALDILREYKVPFIVAATKVDAMSGWIADKNACFSETLSRQRLDVQEHLDKKLYELVGSLYERGFSAERFDRVEDFTKQILIVPVSARTGEGLQELLMYVAGLAQKFLEKRLELHSDQGGKGSILEVREEPGLGKTLDVILYDGSLSEGDTIVFATQSNVATSKVKALLKPKPLDEMRDPRQKFNPVKQVFAASGVKIACEHADEALAGSSIYCVKNAEEEKKLKEALLGEVRKIVVESNELGAVFKADTLGSLEAITKLLASEKISVRRAAIGPVSRHDIVEANGVREKDACKGVVFAFNVPIEEEVRKFAEENRVKIFEEKVIYNLIETYKRWVDEEKTREKKEAFTKLVPPAKIMVLPDSCFRVNHPCVVGVEVMEGTLRKDVELLNAEGVEVGRVQGIQHEKKPLDEAKKGQQIAVSITGPTFGRQVFAKQLLYSNMSKEDMNTIAEKYKQAFSEGEHALISEIKKIKGYSLF